MNIYILLWESDGGYAFQMEQESEKKSVGAQVLLDRKYFSRSIAIRKNTYYQNCVRV